MTAQTVTARARLAAEAQMRDACLITRAGEPVTVDGDVTVPTTTVYDGKCKLQSQRPYPSTPDAAGHSWTLVPLELHLPVTGTEAIQPNDLVEITASVAPENVGRRFVIRSGDRKTFQSAFRPLVEETAG